MVKRTTFFCRALFIALLLLQLVLLSACVSYQHIPFDASAAVAGKALQVRADDVGLAFGSAGLPPQTQTIDLAEVVDNTSSLKRKVVAVLTRRMRTQDLEHYDVIGFEYPSVGSNGQPGDSVKIRYYRGDVPGQWPLLVILPVWGSYGYPVEKVARRIRARYQGRVHIAALLGEERLLDWAGMAAATDIQSLQAHSAVSAERIRFTVVDIRRLVDWAGQQAEIDSSRIALTGFSIGALVGSLVVSHEPRLAASTLIMGGADPAQVLATCNRIAGSTRKQVTRRLGLSVEQYAALMAEVFDPINPVHFAGNTDPSHVLFVDASRDDCMPAEARESLWQSLDQPERYIVDGTHEGAFLSMTFLGADFTTKLIVDFLDTHMNLGMPSDDTETIMVEAGDGEGDGEGDGSKL
jgi:dienelactone hydrolase